VGDTIRVRSLFREYRIEFSENAVATISPQLKHEETFVVCDERVFNIWREYLSPLICQSRLMLVSPTEQAKTIDKSQELIEKMIAAGTRRNHTILAIGGGITQDLAAFAASLLYRGIEWVFLPTTLLAQADSCVGSKTSINVGDKKNLVGNFWPPRKAVIDTRFLTSLPVDDVRSGIGEILHFYLYSNSPMTRTLLAEYSTLLRDRNMLRPFIEESLCIKRSVVEADEFDRNERHKFNYGHTFGHALESVSGYAIPHGLAVTVGMDIANFLSVQLGIMSESVFDDLHAQLSVNFPSRTFDVGDVDRYIAYLARDKKNYGKSMGCILAERPGVLCPRQVPLDDALRATLTDYFSGPWWR
jgi:3-dehydroquinate synthase